MMNERIKLLAEQAREYAAQNATGDWEVGPDYQDIFNKKFAELIVKEMVDECAKVCVQHAGWTPDMIANQVKQHFGVDEDDERTN